MPENITRGRITALSVGGIGILVLATLIATLKPRIVENYNILQLQSQNDIRREQAALILGRDRSVRAIPALIKVLSTELREYATNVEPSGEGKGLLLTPVAFALYSIGNDAIPQLRKVLVDLESEGRESKLAPATQDSIAATLDTVDTIIKCILARYNHVKMASYAEMERVKAR